jgi:hypothetical protein
MMPPPPIMVALQMDRELTLALLTLVKMVELVIPVTVRVIVLKVGQVQIVIVPSVATVQS